MPDGGAGPPGHRSPGTPPVWIGGCARAARLSRPPDHCTRKTRSNNERTHEQLRWASKFPELGLEPIPVEPCISPEYFERRKEQVFMKTAQGGPRGRDSQCWRLQGQEDPFRQDLGDPDPRQGWQDPRFPQHLLAPGQQGDRGKRRGDLRPQQGSRGDLPLPRLGLRRARPDRPRAGGRTLLTVLGEGLQWPDPGPYRRLGRLHLHQSVQEPVDSLQNYLGGMGRVRQAIPLLR